MSCFMLRQMEYDADRYEYRVAGSEAFGSTFRKLYRLGLAGAPAQAEIAKQWQKGKAINDVPGLVAKMASRLPQELVAAIRKVVHGGSNFLRGPLIYQISFQQKPYLFGQVSGIHRYLKMRHGVGYQKVVRKFPVTR